jgi:hypothetical protein
MVRKTTYALILFVTKAPEILKALSEATDVGEIFSNVVLLCSNWRV